MLLADLVRRTWLGLLPISDKANCCCSWLVQLLLGACCCCYVVGQLLLLLLAGDKKIINCCSCCFGAIRWASLKLLMSNACCCCCCCCLVHGGNWKFEGCCWLAASGWRRCGRGIKISKLWWNGGKARADLLANWLDLLTCCCCQPINSCWYWQRWQIGDLISPVDEVGRCLLKQLVKK